MLFRSVISRAAYRSSVNRTRPDRRSLRMHDTSELEHIAQNARRRPDGKREKHSRDSLQKRPQSRINIHQHIPHDLIPRHLSHLPLARPPLPERRCRIIPLPALLRIRPYLGWPGGRRCVGGTKGGEGGGEGFVVCEEIVCVECVYAVLG